MHSKVDEYLALLPEWQKQFLITFRETIHSLDPTITEDLKWNVPVFIKKNRMIFSMAAFKAHTKYNFILNGALLDDKDNLFNNGLDSKKSRSIDLREGESCHVELLQKLVKQSISLV